MQTRPCRAAFTWVPPAFIFIKFPSTQISADINDATCVSKDGLRVKFGVSFQYQLPMEWVKPVVVKYRNMDKWGGIVYAAGMSAVQHSCSKYDISNFQNKRGIIQSEMESKLRIKLEGPDGDGAGGVYARAVSLQLTNVELPEEYREAVSEKQQADEDIELAKNQRTQETTKANTELLAAKEEAKKINNTATNEAEVITIEATEKAASKYAFETAALYKQIKPTTLTVRKQLAVHGERAVRRERTSRQRDDVLAGVHSIPDGRRRMTHSCKVEK